MEIKVVKLKTGEETIAEVKEAEGGLLLVNPVRFVPVPGPQGQTQIAMQPFSPFTSDKEIFIKADDVIFVANAGDDFKNAWNQEYGSGIVTPPTPELIT